LVKLGVLDEDDVTNSDQFGEKSWTPESVQDVAGGKKEGMKFSS